MAVTGLSTEIPVTVDRCAEHGTWFDPAELEEALEHVALTKDHGFRHWLRHLFE